MSVLIKTLIQKQTPVINAIRKHSTSGEVPRVLITGGLGQLGTGLADLLAAKYGRHNVIITDINRPQKEFLTKGIQYLYADVMDVNGLKKIAATYGITEIVHFSALLSAIGEQNVPLALDINITGMQNILEVARHFKLKCFIPSTIGAFGPDAERDPTPDFTIQRPRTIYGVSKVYAELLGEYYAHKFNVDFRCLRFPGVISADSEPGGGTTDYAVKVFHDAMKTGKFECYLRGDTKLPMMYLDDCLDSVVDFMKVPSESLTQRTYNVSATSFTPEELFEEIRKHVSELEVTYNIDSRQDIADSWPMSFDDSNARKHWNWSPKYSTLEKLVEKMFLELKKQE